MKSSEKKQSVSASFRCGVCGQEASLVTLVPAGQADPRLTPETANIPPGISMILSDTPCLSINGGPVSYTAGLLSDEKVQLVKDALLAQNAAQLYAIDYEFAPFYCPECDCCYCKIHYPSYAVFDDGSFDCNKGTCPKGHKRTLTD